MGKFKGAELKVFVVFVLTALAWMFRTILDDLPGLGGLSDAGIAMISALILFLLPSGKSKKKGVARMERCSRKCSLGFACFIWRWIKSLANAVQATGLAVWLGSLIPVE